MAAQSGCKSAWNRKNNQEMASHGIHYGPMAKHTILCLPASQYKNSPIWGFEHMKQNRNNRPGEKPALNGKENMIEQNNLKYTASPTDPVAVAAFKAWLEAGRPTGRDQEFWRRAEARIQAAKLTAPAPTAEPSKEHSSRMEVEP